MTTEKTVMILILNQKVKTQKGSVILSHFQFVTMEILKNVLG